MPIKRARSGRAAARQQPQSPRIWDDDEDEDSGQLAQARSVVLVDIGLRGESGFDVTQPLVENLPHLHSRVALISTRDPADYVDLIAATPVAGSLPKNRLSVQAIFDLLG